MIRTQLTYYPYLPHLRVQINTYMQRRPSTPIQDALLTSRLSRRPSLRIKEIATCYPKTHMFTRVTSLSPDKLPRSSSTRIPNRIGNGQAFQIQEEEVKIEKSMQRASKMPQMRISQSKISKKSLGAVKAYATNLFSIPNSPNQTRISIVTAMKKPNSDDEEISLFAIYDGYNGNECATFLRDNLHLYIAKEKSFPLDISTALRLAIKAAQEEFNKFAKKSMCEAGSSLLIAVVKGRKLYIGNVGDSKVILSKGLGEELIKLTTDHNPHTQSQFSRLMKSGGMISKQKVSLSQVNYFILPGYRKTSRTIGDYPFKSQHPNIIISEPEITQREIEGDFDFLLLGAERLFGLVDCKQTARQVWVEAINDRADNLHEKGGNIMKSLLTSAATVVESTSGILLLFQGFQKTFWVQDSLVIPFEE